MRHFERTADLGRDGHDQDGRDGVRDAGGDDQADHAEEDEDRPQVQAVHGALQDDVAAVSACFARWQTYTSLSRPDERTARPSEMPPIASATIAQGMLSQSC